MSLSDKQKQILEVAKYVWDNQHEYSLDTVDGTFYWAICQSELFARLLEDARRKPGEGHGRLQNAIPGFDLSRLSIPIHEHRVPLRGAVTEVFTRGRSRSAGVDAMTVVAAKIRNAQWVGADVAEALYGAWVKYQNMWPGDVWEQHRAYLSLASPEHLVMNMQLGPERVGRLLDYSEESTFEFEPDETHVQFTYKPTPNWDYEPYIEIEVSAPPPAKQVIATWFDIVAIDTYGWPSHLKGAVNRQDVATAIRTWAISLLMASGREEFQAFQDVLNILDGVKIPAHATFNENRDRLLDRVAEARSFLKRSQGRSAQGS